MTAPDKLTVEQVDRDAAADIWRDYVAKIGECLAEKGIRSGGVDDGSLVQTIARHRQQAEARPEGLIAAARALAISAGKLNVALDRLEKFRRHKEALVRDMTIFADALTAYRSARP